MTETEHGFPVNTSLLVLITGLLLWAVIIQGGVLNPTIQSTQNEVRGLACAVAEQTANAARVRTEDPRTGELETREHFLTRMLAQRHTLLVAKDIGCKSAPGFPPFDVQVATALREINQILGYRKARPKQSPYRPSASSGGDAPQAGSTGSQPSGPREGGSVGDGETEQPRGGGGGGSGGGQAKPPAGTTTTADPAPVPSAPSPSPSPGRSSDAPGDPEPKGDPPGALPSTVESVGGVVKEAGEGVGGAVEGVGKGVDCALRGSC